VEIHCSEDSKIVTVSFDELPIKFEGYNLKIYNTEGDIVAVKIQETTIEEWNLDHLIDGEYFLVKKGAFSVLRFTLASLRFKDKKIADLIFE
jgi:hypothetical protein